MRTKDYNRLALISILAVTVIVALCLPVTAAERECKIAIVKSWGLGDALKTALEGFFEVMAEHNINCTTTSHDLKGEIDNSLGITEEIQALKPDLILAIGSRATNMVSKSFKDTPIVFAMVLYPVASGFVPSMDKPGANLTGAAMDVPIERQLRALSRIVPDMKRVGVLYSPEETLLVIEEARDVARSMNLELLAEPVGSEGDVPGALSKLDNQKMDALWSVADGKVFTQPSWRYIVKYVVRRGIPFMGPSNGYVKAGALVALTADYADNGRQAAKISIRILNGASPQNIAVATPQMVEMALNLQVANHIRLRIPRNIIEESSQVFE
jgi:putative ABC transport system substrate-binding protein